jgi:tripartite-type tricarboxylate transporter receptor subunit TctC
MGRFLVGVVVLAAAIVQPLQAQDAWPSRPVKLIVPSSPGGGTDVFARLLGQSLETVTKQTFVVENKPGASGNIGAQAAAQSAPDGYTFLVASNSSTAINPYLYKSPGLDVKRDLVPVARGVMGVSVLIVNPAEGINTVADLIARAKQKPETLAYGSAGTGSSPYLGVRMIEEQAGVKFIHVPYKGVGPALQDMMGGRLQFMYTDLASAIPYVNAGKLKVIAIDRKSSLAPGAPTFAEAGLPNFDSPIAFSVLAPAAVPKPIVQRMSVEVNKALKAIAPRLEEQALIPVYDTPAEFATSLDAERNMWQSFITRNGITVDQ